MSNAINGGMLVPEPAMAEMYATGTFVDLLDPQPESIHPEDIAHHSGMACRYGGGVRHFYSVAEHAVLVSELLEVEGHAADILQAGLLHDAAEAYISDIISPAKYALRVIEARRTGQADQFRGDNGAWFEKPPAELRGVYSELTEGLDRAIGERFGIDHELFEHPAVKLADMWALKIEATYLTRSRGANWRWPGELPQGGTKPPEIIWYGGLEPDVAKLTFMERARDLGVTR